MSRVEDRTFCSLSKETGTHQQLGEPFEMPGKMSAIKGCWQGRTMYVLPFSNGTGGLADVADRRTVDRFAYVVGQHAHHGAHRAAVVSGNRKGRETRRRYGIQYGRRLRRVKKMFLPCKLKNTSSFHSYPNLVYGRLWRHALLGKNVSLYACIEHPAR